MCGFLVAPTGVGETRFLRRRGPDVASALEWGGWQFQHFLLSITGEPTPQPFVDGDSVCVYNGEIYNLSYVRSDGENILPAYRDCGADFPNVLDGEFAIAIYDFGRDTALFVTDRFATKPIWVNGAMCASYESGVGGHKVPAHTIEAVCISTGQTRWIQSYHDWDWRQRVGSYDECLEAFERAVERRYRRHCFIGLSSGYDSGAIACALGDRDFKAYVVLASESPRIVSQRVKRLRDVEVIDTFDLHVQAQHLETDAEEFHYAIRYDSGISRASYKSDYAAKALSYICSLAAAERRRVYLSGTGADEILSDYALIPQQSTLKGHFPNILTPWPNFVGSCQYSYLGKEECVAGSWGIETRYPFLDTAFVQAFLSLTPALKNRHYKAPLFAYLTTHHYPFEVDRKIGFLDLRRPL